MRLTFKNRSTVVRSNQRAHVNKLSTYVSAVKTSSIQLAAYLSYLRASDPMITLWVYVLIKYNVKKSVYN